MNAEFIFAVLAGTLGGVGLVMFIYAADKECSQDRLILRCIAILFLLAAATAVAGIYPEIVK